MLPERLAHQAIVDKVYGGVEYEEDLLHVGPDEDPPGIEEGPLVLVLAELALLIHDELVDVQQDPW